MDLKTTSLHEKGYSQCVLAPVDTRIRREVRGVNDDNDENNVTTMTNKKEQVLSLLGGLSTATTFGRG